MKWRVNSQNFSAVNYDSISHTLPVKNLLLPQKQQQNKYYLTSQISYRIYVSKRKIIDIEFAGDVDCGMNNNCSLVGVVNLVQDVAEADKGNVFLLPVAFKQIHITTF